MLIFEKLFQILKTMKNSLNDSKCRIKRLALLSSKEAVLLLHGITLLFKLLSLLQNKKQISLEQKILKK